MLQQQIDLVLASNQLNTGDRILQSEFEASILHKVWLAPIADQNTRDRIAMLGKDVDLRRPRKVDVAGESNSSTGGEN